MDLSHNYIVIILFFCKADIRNKEWWRRELGEMSLVEVEQIMWSFNKIELDNKSGSFMWDARIRWYQRVTQKGKSDIRITFNEAGIENGHRLYPATQNGKKIIFFN